MCKEENLEQEAQFHEEVVNNESFAEEKMGEDQEAPKARRGRPSKTKEPLKPEHSVIILSCLNPRLAQKISKEAEKEGVKIVILEDKVMYDYLQAERSKAEGERTEPEKLTNFINDCNNRSKAEEQALIMWNILTNMADLSTSLTRIFTKSELVQRTTITHKTAEEVLNLLKVFGFMEYTKGAYEFRLVFGKEVRIASLHADVIQSCSDLNVNIQRYKSAVYSNEDVSEKEKHERYAALQSNIDELVEY